MPTHNQKLFYMQDSRTTLGSNTVFWRTNGCGYTTDLDDADVMTLSEAQLQHNCRDTDIPLCVEHVNDGSTLAVDHQYLDAENIVVDALDGLYAVVWNGHYNGNDVCFVERGGLTYTYNYNRAEFFTKNMTDVYVGNREYSIYDRTYLDGISRRTFQYAKINNRKMTSGGGIKLQRKKYYRPTGKTRGNCPTCGKITWDYNPYENAHCETCK